MLNFTNSKKNYYYFYFLTNILNTFDTTGMNDLGDEVATVDDKASLHLVEALLHQHLGLVLGEILSPFAIEDRGDEGRAVAVAAEGDGRHGAEVVHVVEVRLGLGVVVCRELVVVAADERVDEVRPRARAERAGQRRAHEVGRRGRGHLAAVVLHLVEGEVALDELGVVDDVGLLAGRREELVLVDLDDVVLLVVDLDVVVGGGAGNSNHDEAFAAESDGSGRHLLYFFFFLNFFFSNKKEIKLL